jgi:hypothetical protein
MLRQEINQMFQHESIIGALQMELYQRSQYYDTVIATLHQQVPVCNHEATIAALQQELAQRPNYEATIAALQQELSQVPPCNHEQTIAELEQELACANAELEKRAAIRVEERPKHRAGDPSNYPDRSESSVTGNRIESIILDKLGSSGIPDRNMLEEIRKTEPKLRRADLYNRLYSLQRKGVVQETSDRIWRKI